MNFGAFCGEPNRSKMASSSWVTRLSFNTGIISNFVESQSPPLPLEKSIKITDDTQ
jgi:hypothetical protein